MKKPFNFKYKLFFSLIFMQLLLFTGCPDSKEYYYELNKFQITNYDIINKVDILDSDSTNRKNFRIKVFLDYDGYYASNYRLNWNKNLFSGSKLYAMRCSEPRYMGLSKDIQNIEMNYYKGHNEKITINKDELNFYSIRFFDDKKNDRLSQTEWLKIINNGESSPTRDWYLEFKDSILINELISDKLTEFELKITFIDSTMISSNTNKVIIK